MAQGVDYCSPSATMKRAAEGLPPAQQRPAPAPVVVPSKIGEHWDVQAKVGEGTYGSVFKAIDRRTGKEVAIKQMKTTREGEGISHTAYREVRPPEFVLIADGLSCRVPGSAVADRARARARPPEHCLPA